MLNKSKINIVSAVPKDQESEYSKKLKVAINREKHRVNSEGPLMFKGMNLWKPLLSLQSIQGKSRKKSSSRDQMHNFEFDDDVHTGIGEAN